jgi:hypothetical protein
VSVEEKLKCKSSWISYKTSVLESGDTLFVGICRCLVSFGPFFRGHPKHVSNMLRTCFTISWCGQSLGRITQSENKSVHCCWLMLGKRPNHAKSLHCLTTIVETTSHFYQVFFFLTPERVGIRRSKSTNYGLKFPASVQCVFRTKLGPFAQAIHSDISLVYREINQWRNKGSHWLDFVVATVLKYGMYIIWSSWTSVFKLSDFKTARVHWMPAFVQK